MNRELKFRVFNPDEQVNMYFEIHNIWFADRYLMQHKYPVQQYTGLKDWTGKEIYEGDIVRGSFKDTDYMAWSETIAPVVYRDENAGFNLSSENWDKTTIEVIGNVFENPELCA